LRRTFIVLALGLVAMGAWAGDDNGNDKDPFAFSLDVKEKVLDNGLRVLVAPRPGAPRVACAVWFRVGSVDELPGRTGLAHCLEHMMFKGTHRIGVKDAALGDKLDAQLDAIWARKKGQIVEVGSELPKLRAQERAFLGSCGRMLLAGEDVAQIASEAAFLGTKVFRPEDKPYFELRETEAEFTRLILEERKNDRKEELWDTYVAAGGTNLNAFTTEDSTQYVVTLPSNQLELFFWLEADRLTDPVFREWYPERDVVKEERRNDENAADGPFYEALTGVVFGPHPYAHPILGWTKDLDELTPREAYEFFEEHYSPENATCVLAGDVDPEKAFALAARYLGKVPKRKTRKTLVPVEPTCPGEKRFQQEAETEPRVEIYWRAPDPRSRENDVLGVIATLLSGESGRLYKKVVEEETIATSVDASLDQHRYAARFHVGARAKPDSDLDKLESDLDEEVTALTTNLVPPEELERAKGRIAADVVRGLEDLEGTTERLGQGATLYGDWRSLVERGKRVRSVTAEEVRAVAKKTFRKAGRTVGVLVRGPGEPEPAEETKEDELTPQVHPHSSRPGHRTGNKGVTK
jgi:predicted Zn-dependent peptidase